MTLIQSGKSIVRIIVLFVAFNASGERFLDKIPETSFTCGGRNPGFYVDPHPASRCQVYHMCDTLERKHSYLCPNLTMFHQTHLTCAHAKQVDCRASETNYFVNSRLYESRESYLGENEKHATVTNTGRESLSNPLIRDHARRYRTNGQRRVNKYTLVNQHATRSVESTFSRSERIIGVSVKSTVVAKVDPIPVLISPSERGTDFGAFHRSSIINEQDASFKLNPSIVTRDLASSNTPRIISVGSFIYKGQPEIQNTGRPNRRYAATKPTSFEPKTREPSEPLALNRQDFIDKLDGLFGTKIKEGSDVVETGYTDTQNRQILLVTSRRNLPENIQETSDSTDRQNIHERKEQTGQKSNNHSKKIIYPPSQADGTNSENPLVCNSSLNCNHQAENRRRSPINPRRKLEINGNQNHRRTDIRPDIPSPDHASFSSLGNNFGPTNYPATITVDENSRDSSRPSQTIESSSFPGEEVNRNNEIKQQNEISVSVLGGPPSNDEKSKIEGTRLCSGCMLHFIQNLDTCFPCVHPR